MMMKYMQDNGVDITTSNWGNYDDVALTNLRGYYTDVIEGATNGFKSTNGITRNKCRSEFICNINNRSNGADKKTKFI